MIVESANDHLRVLLDDVVLLAHRTDEPAFFAGVGEPESNLHRGNFKVLDRKLARFPLELVGVEQKAGLTVATLKRAQSERVEATITIGQDGENIGVELHGGELNRFWIRLRNEVGEHLWGGGEQFSHFNLAGRRFPMWTQEPGVGRDMTTRMALIAENDGKAGAHEAATYYPQPTFISSRHYALHVDSPAYAVLDFTSPMFHEIEVWDTDFRFELFRGASLEDLVRQLARRFGHGGQIPEWVYNGAILGLKRGTERNFEILEQALAAGVHVSGMWSEDWCGLRHTSFGARLFWDWQWSEKRYPQLPEKHQRAEGARHPLPRLQQPQPVLGRAAVQGGRREGAASRRTRTARRAPSTSASSTAASSTSPAPKAGRLVQGPDHRPNMLDLGVSGWMADFGEYAPTDMQVASGEDGWKVHNQWPALWARVNAGRSPKRG